MGRDSVLHWDRRELTLRATGNFSQERYALLDGRRELGRFSGRSWGRSRVRCTLADGTVLEPGLLLFTVFVVRGLAEYATQRRRTTAG